MGVQLLRTDLRMDRRTDMTKLIVFFSAVFPNATKNKTGIIQTSSNHQQQRLWKKLEGYHELIVSEGFQETFQVLDEDYIQTFHSPERQGKRKVTGHSVIGNNFEKIAAGMEV